MSEDEMFIVRARRYHRHMIATRRLMIAAIIMGLLDLIVGIYAIVTW